MNKFKLMITLITLITSFSAFGAGLCAPNSCNPYNGCTDGCEKKQVVGVASCTETDLKTAKKQAFADADKQGKLLCARGYFNLFDWSTQVSQSQVHCVVQVQGIISCY